MKYFLFVLGMLALTTTSIAQQKDTLSGNNVEPNLYKLKLIMPGIGYERSLFNNFSLSADMVFTYFGGFSGRPSAGIDMYLGTQLKAKIQGRYYYNFGARKELGRNTFGNSANYFAAQFVVTRGLFDLVQPPETARVNRFGFHPVVGIIWGMQRSYKSNLFINVELGLNYAFRSGTGYATQPHLGFSLGYLLFRNHQMKK